MYHYSMRLIVIFTFAVLVIGIALALPMFIDRSPDDTVPQTQLADGELSEVTPLEARRIHELDQPGQPAAPPFSDAERGVVLERTENLIRLEGRVTPRAWPLADDVSVWHHGEQISVDEVQQGDTVSVVVRKVGSRSDGYIPTVVQIELDPAAGLQRPAEVADPVNGESDSTTTITPAGPSEIRYTGRVTDLRNRVIVIVDDLGDRLEFPVSASATVREQEEIGSLDSVQIGDTVTLVGSRVGTAADGYTIQVSRIAIQPSSEEPGSDTIESQ